MRNGLPIIGMNSNLTEFFRISFLLEDGDMAPTMDLTGQVLLLLFLGIYIYFMATLSL